MRQRPAEHRLAPGAHATRRGLSALAIGASALAFGCASGGSRGFTEDYSAGRYSEAYRDSSKAARSATGASRDEAALIAGLSAQAMGRNAEAETWLKPLATSRDRQVAGRAQAALGLIASSRREHDQAATSLSQAAGMLTGDDAAQAGLHAGDAYAAAGRPEAARVQYNLAYGAAQSSELKNVLSERLSRSAYTVQVGAFSSRQNADRAAREVSSMAVGLGLGSPAVVATEDARGRPMYAVQVGRFKTKDEADKVRKRLGPNTIVASAPSSS